MTTNLDIYRAANIFIKRYGDDDAIEDAMRADAMLDKGETSGHLVWKRIVEAITKSSTGSGRSRAAPGRATRTDVRS